MKKLSLILIVMSIGLIALSGTAIAADQDTKCEFLISNTKPEEEGIIYYINPANISHLATLTDKTATGAEPRYILIIVMNNSSIIEYNRFRNTEYRHNALNYIMDNVNKCRN